MTTSDEQENPEDPEHEQEAAELVRPHVITNGRELSETERFDLVTLVTASGPDRRTDLLGPEKQSLLRLCAGGYLSVAEIAGHLRLPTGVVKVLLLDLEDTGHIVTRSPAPPAQLADVQVLQEVLDGLQSRFG